MVEVIHQGCGQVAFHYAHPPKAGDVLEARKATLLDGTVPRPCTEVRCGACGQGFTPTLRDVRLR